MNRFIGSLAGVCVALACAVVLLAFPVAAPAHHSVANYDMSAMKEFEGTVAKVFWSNPHVIVRVTAQENGKPVTWTLDGASVSSQSRRGYTAAMIKVGDRIRFAGHVSLAAGHTMLVQNLLLPDGREIMLNGSVPQHWPQSTFVTFKTGVDAAAAARAKADGLFRVWSWGALERGWWFFGDTDRFPLTQAALAKFAKWDKDNPQLKCIPPGMPNTMGNPYPIEFVRAGKNIELHLEEFDNRRIIHMDGSTGAGVAPSPLGYSVGRWEGKDTLVVTTSRINWPWFNRVGVSQGPDVTTLEKFTVDDAQGKLHYELTVTDPWALKEPYRFKALWVWKPGEKVDVYGCKVDK